MVVSGLVHTRSDGGVNGAHGRRQSVSDETDRINRATTRTEQPLICISAGQGLFIGAACRHRTDDLITSALRLSLDAPTGRTSR